ncbi:hypothetical protein O0D30_10865 [Staphylococcus pseudintermedius]|nr:hypothetical protein [Staphylococcus pseudintermedius]MDK3933470.1 hypothetical protein [Staphylococcus pseudintermedius]RYS14792.1 hypothetical protein DLS53_01025 [Staphylococcus pseudintermedius]HAR5727630.1 hypothetical protein [Staphylococcus pseudintermedius]
MDFCFKIITMEIMSFSEFCMAHENRRVPNWMIRDFNGLNDTNLWDYYESYNSLRLICLSESYLHDALKFVLKDNSNDLIYDFYVFLMFDESVCDIDSIVLSVEMNKLIIQYHTKFEAEFNFDSEILGPPGDFDIESMDNLPF